MKPFYYKKTATDDLPDWKFALLCFEPLDVLSLNIYTMVPLTWKECFSFGFTFCDYSLFEFNFTIGKYDGVFTFLNFSSSRSSMTEYYESFYK